VVLLENEGYLRFRRGEFDHALRAFESSLRQPEAARPMEYREMGTLWESSGSSRGENAMMTEGEIPSLREFPSGFRPRRERASLLPLPGPPGSGNLSLPREVFPRNLFRRCCSGPFALIRK
jgi:hypothetical protein